jgi:GTP cyclohydrolase II
MADKGHLDISNGLLALRDRLEKEDLRKVPRILDFFEVKSVQLLTDDQLQATEFNAVIPTTATPLMPSSPGNIHRGNMSLYKDETSNRLLKDALSKIMDVEGPNSPFLNVLLDESASSTLHDASSVLEVAKTHIHTTEGTFTLRLFAGHGHITPVLTTGIRTNPADGPYDNVTGRINSGCVTGEVLGCQRCDCGPQLHQAMKTIHAEGMGFVVYLPYHEGRGIGAVEKIRAYQLQDSGLDTVDANLELGHPEDLRDFSIAPDILRALHLRSIRLLTNNPLKVNSLKRDGFPNVDARPLNVAVTGQSEPYLSAKKKRMGHQLEKV